MQFLKRIFKVKDIRQSLLFVLLALTIFRLAAHVPIPGLDSAGVANMLAKNQFLGLLNVFSGGTLRHISVVSLGVAPYITASIVVQLLGMIFPGVEEMQKEEAGRQRLNRWTRNLTVPVSLLQGYALIKLLGQQGLITGQFDMVTMISALVSMVAGTVFLMWLGELISEKQVGNGISIMILAGIIAGFPQFIQQLAVTYTSADTLNIVLFVVLLLITIVGVVYITEGQRNIPVQYARGSRTGSTSQVQSHLPLRINMAGMIPIMFGIAVLVFPPLVAQFFLQARTQILRDIATETLKLFGNNVFHGIFYFILVFAFTYFYTSVVFKPESVAENLQKQGGFIPGIRPGVETAKYLDRTKNRLLLSGATFLALIAVLPVIVQGITGSQNLVVGGSSLIIIVGVIIDMMKQLDSQVSVHEYEIN